MKLGIMQPYYFPYIGYWQLINAVDVFVIYDDVNYIKKGWIHRNRVLMNGRSTWLHLNIDHASQNKLINQVEIIVDPVYQDKQLKTLEHCYRKAPYYSQAIQVIEKVIRQTEPNLAKYLEFEIRSICYYLSIDTELIMSSSIKKRNELHGQDKIIEICNLLGFDEYVNAIGGVDLYSSEVFTAHDIQLGFLEPSEIKYTQFMDEFVPNLSIIDVMMFNDKTTIKDMLGDYKIVPAEKFTPEAS